MALRHARSGNELFSTCLHGRVLAQGRSFPVTITALSEDGLVAEGSELALLLGEFTLEMALESSRDTAWNPKASGPEFLHFFTASAEREVDGGGSGRVSARFTGMSDTARRVLSAYLARLEGGRAARSPGGGLSRTPEGLAGRA